MIQNYPPQKPTVAFKSACSDDPLLIPEWRVWATGGEPPQSPQVQLMSTHLRLPAREDIPRMDFRSTRDTSKHVVVYKLCHSYWQRAERGFHQAVDGDLSALET
ncbi:hypothetical protein MTO96_004480 [Rhipicephalus appendiculatus]